MLQTTQPSVSSFYLRQVKDAGLTFSVPKRSLPSITVQPSYPRLCCSTDSSYDPMSTNYSTRKTSSGGASSNRIPKKDSGLNQPLSNAQCQAVRTNLKGHELPNQDFQISGPLQGDALKARLREAELEGAAKALTGYFSLAGKLSLNPKVNVCKMYIIKDRRVCR